MSLLEKSFSELCEVTHVHGSEYHPKDGLHYFYFKILVSPMSSITYPVFEKFRDDLNNDTDFIGNLSLTVDVSMVINHLNNDRVLNMKDNLFEFKKLLVIATNDQDAITFKMKYLS